MYITMSVITVGVLRNYPDTFWGKAIQKDYMGPHSHNKTLSPTNMYNLLIRILMVSCHIMQITSKLGKQFLNSDARL